jgi:hypothetical protein
VGGGVIADSRDALIEHLDKQIELLAYLFEIDEDPSRSDDPVSVRDYMKGSLAAYTIVRESLERGDF